MKLKSNSEYRKAKLPVGIPRCPEEVYDEWQQGWSNFLGTERNFYFMKIAKFGLQIT